LLQIENPKIKIKIYEGIEPLHSYHAPIFQEGALKMHKNTQSTTKG
jgi:hypothetical protein